MVVMRLYPITSYKIKCLLVVLTVFLSSCVSNYSSQSNTSSEAYGNFLSERELVNPTGHPFLLFMRLHQGVNFSLNSNEIELHKKSVYYALNFSDSGELVEWHSPYREAFGKIKVIETIKDVKDFNVCRSYQSLLSINTKERFIKNYACQKSNYEWVFLK